MSRTARETAELLINWVPAQRWDDLPSLYAEDAVVDQPLALPSPVRIHGREGLRAHFAAAASLPLRMRASNLIIHETTDPEVVIAEFDYIAQQTSSGAEFTVANVFVVRVRNGLIVESRDYSNQVLFAAAFGRLGDIANGLSAGTGSH